MPFLVVKPRSVPFSVVGTLSTLEREEAFVAIQFLVMAFCGVIGVSEIMRWFDILVS